MLELEMTRPDREITIPAESAGVCAATPSGPTMITIAVASV
jgi:hypothetical protein